MKPIIDPTPITASRCPGCTRELHRAAYRITWWGQVVADQLCGWCAVGWQRPEVEAIQEKDFDLRRSA